MKDWRMETGQVTRFDLAIQTVFPERYWSFFLFSRNREQDEGKNLTWSWVNCARSLKRKKPAKPMVIMVRVWRSSRGMKGEKNLENRVWMWEGKTGDFLMTGRDLERLQEAKI
jgi:hypothetical protein